MYIEHLKNFYIEIFVNCLFVTSVSLACCLEFKIDVICDHLKSKTWFFGVLG